MVETIVAHRAGAGRALAASRRRPIDGGDRRTEGRGAARRVRCGAGRFGCSLTRGGWGLAALLLLPHLTLLLVSFVPVGTWTTEPLPPGVHARATTPRWCRIRCGRGRWSTVSGWRRRRRSPPWPRAGRRPRGGAAPRPRRRGDRDPARAPVGGAGDGLRDRPRHRVQRAGAVGRPRFVLVGTIWILPLAYLVRNLPITSRAILAGVPRAGSLARRSRRHARGRPRAHAAPDHAAAAPAGAPGGRQPRVRHRVRRFRDLDHALHLRHAAGLAGDPLEPAPGGCRGGRGLRRRAHAGERRRVRVWAPTAGARG